MGGEYFGARSQSGNILAVGAYGERQDGVYGAGAAYLYQMESNGSATYLTKVIAPDMAETDLFWTIRLSVRKIFLPLVRLTRSGWVGGCWSRLSL